MENEIPTTQLVQLYGQEYSAALSLATTRLIRAREWLDTSKFPLHRAKAREQITSASKIITNIALALRREIARINNEWLTYALEDIKDAWSYGNWLKHLLDRGLFTDEDLGNTEKEMENGPEEID